VKKEPPQPKAKPSAGEAPTSGGSGDSRGGSAPPAAPHPGVYKVTVAAPVYLSEARAEISAQFLDAFGQPAYRLSFSPRSGAFAQTPPALGGDSFAFDTATGKVWIDVLSVDWERQTLTVRPRLETG
jgi:hypothetical protein